MRWKQLNETQYVSALPDDTGLYLRIIVTYDPVYKNVPPLRHVSVSKGNLEGDPLTKVSDKEFLSVKQDFMFACPHCVEEPAELNPLVRHLWEK